jgi:hypothetical protein
LKLHFSALSTAYQQNTQINSHHPICPYVETQRRSGIGSEHETERQGVMTFNTVSYAAPSFDFALEPEAAEAARYSHSLTAFLLRLAAYFQSCLASLPRAPQASITVIDTSMDDSSEPLIKVRMNRHLSRRLRWLIRRGRVERSGELRVATAEDEARCNLTPGQFLEYGIRVHRMSRIRVYGIPARR